MQVTHTNDSLRRAQRNNNNELNNRHSSIDNNMTQNS